MRTTPQEFTQKVYGEDSEPYVRSIEIFFKDGGYAHYTGFLAAFIPTFQSTHLCIEWRDDGRIRHSVDDIKETFESREYL